jgi:hypothetical protein
MRESRSFSSVRRMSGSLPSAFGTLSVAMRLLSAAALVSLDCSDRSVSARRLRCANISCSSLPICSASYSSISALILRSSSVCGLAKPCPSLCRYPRLRALLPLLIQPHELLDVDVGVPFANVLVLVRADLG